MKKLCLLFYLFSYSTFAQKTRIDSLLTVIKNNPAQDTVKVNQLISLGGAFRSERKYDKAMSFANQALVLAKKNNFTSGILRALRGIAFDYQRMDKIQESIDVQLEIYQLFEKNPAWRDRFYSSYSNLYLELTIVYTLKGDYSSAQKYGIEGLKDAESRQNYRNIGIICNSLANIARYQKDYDSLFKYLQKSLENNEKAKSIVGVANSLSGLASAYLLTKQNEKAIEYHQKAIEKYKILGDKANIRRSLSNISVALVYARRLDEAEKAAKEALTMVDTKNHYDMVYMNSALVDVYTAKKDYTLALKHANECLFHALKTNQHRLTSLRDAYEQLMEVHLAKKDTLASYRYLEKLLVTKDSLYTVESVQKVNELSKKYEIEKKEQEILSLNKENELKKQQLEQEILLSKSLQTENLTKQQLLQKEQLLRIALGREVNLKEKQIVQEQAIQESLERENELKKSELDKEKKLKRSLENQNFLMKNNSENERLIRWLLFAGLLGLGVFGVWYYRNYQKQRAANALIAKQAEDLKFLMKEVHHRVKNNLQVVSAMLRMQTRALEGESTAANALQNAEKRLKAIALLHEKLYKTEGIESINIGEYIKDLMEIIAKQSHLPNQKFEYFINDAVQYKTNLDTALPIGLLVNEVVNNAFKHAFQGLEKPKIWIDLNKNQEHLELKIKDNGHGLPDESVLKKSKTLGFKLINLFTEQLNGTLRYGSNDGAEFVVRFRANTLSK